MDINLIVTDLIKDFTSTVVRKGADIGNAQYEKARVGFELCFKRYLMRSHERYSKIKTLLYRDRPVSLTKHYVCTDFSLDRNKISGDILLDKIRDNKKNIVMGTAGSGKSVLLRKMFLESLENKKGFIPILIELRLLINPSGGISIYDYIYKSLSDLEKKFTKDQFEYALEKGKFILFLDGFDEIDYDKKEIYESEILGLSNKYFESIFVISSRPDECFSSWDEFFVYKTLPLNKEQSVDLIGRIEYDDEVKLKFIDELNNGLYDKHRDFLSNPLLLTMMLLTYEQLAEIPEKIHIFYEQAFDTLFHKHDAIKALYKRRSYSGLPIDEFKKIFSTFCIITYSDSKMSFTKHEIISYIDKALTIETNEADSVSIFKDLVESVCIIQKDGNLYTFSHRSFQEYFTAYYISISQFIDVKNILDCISISHPKDNVMSMIFELNIEKVETKWVIPKIEEFLSIGKIYLDRKDFLSFIGLFHEGIYFKDGARGYYSGGNFLSENGRFLSVVRRLYLKKMKSLAHFENNGFGSNDLRSDFLNYADEVIGSNVVKALNFKEFPTDSSWFNETSFPKACESEYAFYSEILKNLVDKYERKDKSLSSLLLGFNKK